MQEFDRVLRAFQDADVEFESRWRAAQARNAPQTTARLKLKQQINSKAYFVLLWAQFEDGLIAKVDKLLVRKQLLKNVGDRRPWAVLVGRRLSVMDRAALLSDKNSPTYLQLQRYYKLRNEFAHERLSMKQIDLHLIARDLGALYQRLRA